MRGQPFTDPVDPFTSQEHPRPDARRGEGVGAIESPLLTLSPARRASLVQQAKEIFDKERRKKTLVTFCQDLDQILGGGIRTGQITEFCGAPGVGKTQIMMQLAINVQMPAAFNGLGGEAVYVDTEGSFAAKRCLHMASAFAKHLEKVALRRKDDALLREARQLEPEGILDRIHYFRARDATELLAVIDVLPSFVQDHPNVKIVIIDSIAFHFRQDFDDIGARTRRLIQMGQSLMELAHARDLAVVMTNHVTTKIMGEGKSRLVGIGRGLHSLDRCLTRSLDHSITRSRYAFVRFRRWATRGHMRPRIECFATGKAERDTRMYSNPRSSQRPGRSLRFRAMGFAGRRGEHRRRGPSGSSRRSR